MALHESKLVGISGDDCEIGWSIRITVASNGLYQLIYGGTTSTNGGSEIEIHRNYEYFPIDTLSIPKYTTNSDIAIKELVIFLEAGDLIYNSNSDGNVHGFFALQKIE